MRIFGKPTVGFVVTVALGLALNGTVAADYEDLQIIDANTLKRFGFPPDADNVYERVYLDLDEQADDDLAEPAGGFGPSTNYS